MKKTYQTPEMIAVILVDEDIITGSAISCEENGYAGIWDFSQL